MVARCPWYVAGPFLGLIIIGLRLMLNKPLGALGGWVEFVDLLTSERPLGVPGYLAIGTVAGGLLFALATGTFQPALSYGSASSTLASTSAGQVAMLMVAGLAMGFGARMAGGCTSGHGLCGTSLGSSASLVATITFFTTAVIVSRILAMP
jgi:uncharacterized membrane protein YedE/YeeE